MATARTGRTRGRPEGYRKPWRTDPDRHVIAMASGLGQVIEIDTLTAIRLAILCHYHDPVRFAAHMTRRMNLRPKVLRRIEADWHLDIFKEHPDDDADPHGTYLKAEAKRVTRQWQRWHGDTEFETWRTHMTLVWTATLCVGQSPATTGIALIDEGNIDVALKKDVATHCASLIDEGNTVAALKQDIANRCWSVDETIYANSILIPLVNQALRFNS